MEINSNLVDNIFLTFLPIYKFFHPSPILYTFNRRGEEIDFARRVVLKQFFFFIVVECKISRETSF